MGERGGRGGEAGEEQEGPYNPWEISTQFGSQVSALLGSSLTSQARAGQVGGPSSWSNNPLPASDTAYYIYCQGLFIYQSPHPY